MADLLLKAEALDKIYGKGEAATHALRGVSFEIEEGEFGAIIGQSGSGKSTLLNLLGLLDTPTAGTVSYRGTEVGTLGKPGRAKLRNDLIGFVFQFHYLLPEFSVIDNVLMPSAIAGPLDEELRRRAVENLISLGLEGLADKNANDLSGGQKQRVAIARALMNQPALILADEPTGNLGPDLAFEIMSLFRDINASGTTVLVATHDRDLIRRVGRRTITLTQGKIAEG